MPVVRDGPRVYNGNIHTVNGIDVPERDTMGGHSDQNSSSANTFDLHELRAETLARLRWLLLILVFVVLAVTANQNEPPRHLKWLVLAPVLAAAGASRLRRYNLSLASILVVSCLTLSVLAAIIVFPGQQFEFGFALLVFVAGYLFGDLAAVATGGIGSAFILLWLSTLAGTEGGSAPQTALVMIWLATSLFWLGDRSRRTILAWSWSSYLLALQKAEELREQRGELGRLAKSLTETCIQLEELNQELERARRIADEARHLKAEFAATISHELRTPLNLVIGFSELILRDPDALAGDDLPGRYRNALSAIHRNASHISRLVDDILDLSQIEAHRMALTKTWTSLVSIVDDAVSTIASLYDHLGLTLAVEIPDDLPPLYVDVNRIRQVLINLLSNAARYTDHGGVTIRAMHDGHDVRIVVSDTGEGIAPDDLPYVFQEFRQVGGPGRRRGGSGLGLAVCKAFVEMHGGSIWVESTPGQGSDFSFTLPISTTVVSVPVTLPPTLSITDARTILVLDPDPDAAKPFRRYLDGYHVVWVGGMKDFESFVAYHPVHAVIVIDEAFLPWVRSVRRVNGHLLEVPLFTCPLRTPRTMAEASGANEYLVKPVSQDDLLASLRRWGNDPQRILIVEDDPEMAGLLASMVRSTLRTCQILLAGDGEGALALARQEKPDVILLDLLLPTTNGYQVIHTIRDDPALSAIPIIVVSAKGPTTELVRVQALKLSRVDGLTIGEVMRCLKSSLDQLLHDAGADSDPRLPTALVG